ALTGNSLNNQQPEYTGVAVSEETVLKALALILDTNTHPLLIVDNEAGLRVGVIVGCLRKAQGWALTSIIEEFRRFVGGRAMIQNEQFIELFDTDLVNLPS